MYKLILICLAISTVRLATSTTCSQIESLTATFVGEKVTKTDQPTGTVKATYVNKQLVLVFALTNVKASICEATNMCEFLVQTGACTTAATAVTATNVMSSFPWTRAIPASTLPRSNLYFSTTSAPGEAITKTYTEKLGEEGTGFNLYDYVGRCAIIKKHGAVTATAPANSVAFPDVHS